MKCIITRSKCALIAEMQHDYQWITSAYISLQYLKTKYCEKIPLPNLTLVIRQMQVAFFADGCFQFESGGDGGDFGGVHAAFFV